MVDEHCVEMIGMQIIVAFDILMNSNARRNQIWFCDTNY